MNPEKQTDIEREEYLENRLPETFEAFTSEHPSANGLIHQAIAIDRARNKVQQSTSPYDTPYDQWPARKDLPQYIGGGLEKAAYDLEDNYIVKVLNRRNYTEGETYEFETSFSRQVNGLLAGRGVQGLEQIVTADRSQGIIVTGRVPGKSILRIPNTNLAGQIKKEHIQKLDDTLRYMREHLLTYENAANVFFDPEEGFSIVDYHSYENSVDGSDPDNPAYSQIQEGHQLEPFLRFVLSQKTKELKGNFDEYGNAETILKKSFGGNIIAAIALKRRRK